MELPLLNHLDLDYILRLESSRFCCNGFVLLWNETYRILILKLVLEIVGQIAQRAREREGPDRLW